MFTGIVEALGEIVEIQKEKGNVHFKVESRIGHELKIDQSLSHDGVCLTVTRLEESFHWVTAISETLLKTNLGQWKVGSKVNLERCLSVNGRFDGHIVQGHIDGIGLCVKTEEDNGSWRYWFEYDPEIKEVTVQKGSICINGVSLTVVDSGQNSFSVAIIPYTYENTSFRILKKGDLVNLEFDIVGKYIRRMVNQ